VLHRAHVVVVGFLLERALAHDVSAQRGVSDVRGVVDRLGELVDDVHVLPERRPVPLDRCRDRFGGDVFGADQVRENHVALLGGAGREGEAAVAHDDGSDAVPRGAASDRVPEDLRVHVGVAVDEARRDDLAGRVDFFFAFFADAADRRDPIAIHRDVGAVARQSGSIDDGAVTDHEIVHVDSFLGLTRTVRQREPSACSSGGYPEVAAADFCQLRDALVDFFVRGTCKA
jgi:hypothetical protein